MNAQMFTLIIYCFGFFLLTTSCEEVVEWDLDPEANGNLVVEAIVTNEQIRQEIRLTLSQSGINDDPVQVLDARVDLRSITGITEFILDDVSLGIYRTKEPFAAKKDTPYELHIDWNNQVFAAKSQLSFVSPINAISFVPAGLDSFRLAEVGSVYHPLEQSMYKVDISWAHIAPTSANQAKMLFYTFRTIDGNQLVAPDKEEVIFPRGSLVLVRKFGLDAAFGDYLRTLVMETQWQGGAFDEASSSLNSNISNNAHGFFSICSVTKKIVIAR